MKRLFTLLLLSFAALSCEMTDGNIDDLLDKRDWVVFAEGTELTANVPSKQTVLNYKFESILDWEAKTDAEWLEVDPMSGKAGKDIKIQIKVAKNKDKEGRTGYVDLTLSNDESYRITINQTGEDDENDEGDENEGTIVDIPNNQIWYTSVDGEVVEPYSGESDTITTFGVNIVSNTYKDGKGVIEFEGDVTMIGGFAFENCDSLTSVTIPDSVTTIGECAFYECTSLTSVTIGDSVTTIGGSAFCECTSLTSVTIPDSVTTIEDKAFAYCSSLTSVYCKPTTPPAGGSDMFSDNVSDRKIYVPMESVEAYKSASGWSEYADAIVAYDFDRNEEVVQPEQPEEIPNNQIWYTSVDGEVVEPYSGEYNNNADALTTFGVNIVSNTYKDGKGVIEFDGDVTMIGGWAFAYCTNLKNITFPKGISIIGNQSFWECTNLTDVVIPDSVTGIGVQAFYYCSSITEITIPESVTVLGGGVFGGCSSLKEFKGKFVADNGRCLIDGSTFIAYAGASGTEYTLPEHVTTISNHAFAACDIQKVVIPEGVTEIGRSAFISCQSLAEVSLPNSLKIIGDHTFRHCYSLTNLNIPSLTQMGIYSFAQCSSLENVKMNNGLTMIGEAAFYGCTSLASVTIPDSVTTVGGYAFLECSSLTSVTMGKNIETVGGYAFSGCGSLNAVYITDLVAWCNIDFVNPMNSGFQLEANPLFYAQNLYLNGELITELVIPESVTDIKFLAFIGSSASNIVFHDNVKSIGACAFSRWQNLENVVIDNSVESIGNVAFGHCPNLTSVTMSDGLTSFGFNVFLFSSNLREFKGKLATEDGRALIKDNIFFTYANASGSEYTIPDGITIIGDGAFFSSVGLKSITIPESVTAIGYMAFGKDTDIESIYCKATTPPSTGGSIYQSNSCNIYVPYESYQNYVTAGNWMAYAAQIIPYDYENKCVVEANASVETKRWLGKWSSTVSRTYCPETGFNEETVTFEVNIEHNAVAPNFVKVYGLSVIDPTIAVDGIVNANGDLEILNYGYVGNSGNWNLYMWAMSESGALTYDRHAVYTMSMDESGNVSCEVGSFNSLQYIIFDIFGYNTANGSVSWYDGSLSYYSGPMSWVKVTDSGATPSRYSQKVPYRANFRPQADARLKVVE